MPVNTEAATGDPVNRYGISPSALNVVYVTLIAPMLLSNREMMAILRPIFITARVAASAPRNVPLLPYTW